MPPVIAKVEKIRNTLAVLIVLISFGTLDAASNNKTLAPGYGKLAFSAPSPGSYPLPHLGMAASGEVLDREGQGIALHGLMGDKIVLLSFIYSTCSDINGCPLATAVFYKIKNRLSSQPELAKRLRLLTLSFNPTQDTPAAMKRYGSGFKSSELDWRFLTTASEAELKPILENYGQTVQKQYDDQGKFTRTFSHILRVFLIDHEMQIRNIYSVSFLHADIVINDIKTLLSIGTALGNMDTKAEIVSTENKVAPLYKAGDNKSNYESIEYQTNSIALTDRRGQSTDLMRNVKLPPRGLPPLSVPHDNPVTHEKIELGKKLFYDRRLSVNNTVSCAMCHIPEQGFTNNEMSTSIGVEGRTVRRNAPTLYNVGYAHHLFHDGRESTLERQVWAPLLAYNEMANPSIGYVIDKLSDTDGYQGLFEAAFGTGPNMVNIGKAIASYQRTLNSANSPFDRWYYDGVNDAVIESAKRGFRLFSGKAQCVGCHYIGKNYALFSDNQFHNTGLGFRQTMKKGFDKQRLQVAPGIFLDVDAAAVNSVSEPKPNDLGRYEITQSPQDLWKYKTPSLRNIALTAPYMHDGSLLSLKSVVEYYNQGGVAHDNLDPLINPLSLTNDEINDLISFFESLTGDNIATLVSDAFVAPIGVAR